MELLLIISLIVSLNAQGIFDPNAPAPAPGTVELPGVQGLGDGGVTTLTGSATIDSSVLTTDFKPTTKIIYTPELRATMKEFGITEAKLKEMLDQQRVTGKPTNLTIEEDGGEKVITWDFSQLRSAGVIDDSTLNQLEGMNTDVSSALGTSPSSSSSSVGSGTGTSGSRLQSSAFGGLSTLLNSQSSSGESRRVGGISRDTSLTPTKTITRDEGLIGGIGNLRDAGLIGGSSSSKVPGLSGLLRGTGIRRDTDLGGATDKVRDSNLVGGTGISRDPSLIGGSGVIRDSDLIGGTGNVRDIDLIGGTRDSSLIGATGIPRDTGVIRDVTRGEVLPRDRTFLRGTSTSGDPRQIGGVGLNRDPGLIRGIGAPRDSDIRGDPRLATGGGLMQLVAGSGGLPSGSVSTGTGVIGDDGVGAIPSGISIHPGTDSRGPQGTSRREPFVLDELNKQIQDLINKVNKMHKDLFAKTLKLTDQEYAAEEAKIALEERKLADLIRREKELSSMPGLSDPMGRPRDEADVVAMEAERRRQIIMDEVREMQRRNEELVRSLNAEAANRARSIDGIPQTPLDPRPPVADPSPSARRVLDREIVRDTRVRSDIPDVRNDPRMPSEEVLRLEREREALRRDYDRLQALLERRRRMNGPMQNYPRIQRRQPMPPVDRRRPDRSMGPIGTFPRMDLDRTPRIIPDRFRQQRGYPVYDPYFMYQRGMVASRRRRPISTVTSRGQNRRMRSDQLPILQENRPTERSQSSRSPFSLGADIQVTEMRNDGAFDNAVPRPFPTYFMESGSGQIMPGSSGFSSFSSGMITPGMETYLPRTQLGASPSTRFVRTTDSNPIFLRGASTINFIPGQTPRNRISF